MKNPVIDPDGNSYEREAIYEWLSNNTISPITRNPLKQTDLVPNRALKDIIENFIKNSNGNIEEKRHINIKQSDKITLKSLSTITDTLVSLIPPEGNERTPIDICCVIDTSGSMGSEASVKSSSGQSETHGLTILDIVKHAVKTIIYTLDESDRLGIVNFDSLAQKALNLTNMTASGRKSSIDKVDELDPNGSTNLWAGLRLGLDMLKDDVNQERLKVVLLLTDGEPTIIPPRGHIPVLNEYLKEFPSIGNYLIFTFGFGYNLDSKLLNEIAAVGNGTYSFIPDCNFVGTVFINSMANLSTIMASDIELKLSTSATLNSLKAPGYNIKKQGNDVVLKIGSLRYGQSKDIILNYEADSPPPVQVTITYRDINNKNELSQTSIESTSIQTKEVDEIQIHQFRLQAVEILQKLVQNPKEKNEEIVKRLISQISNSFVLKNEFIQDLLKDLEGQVIEAITDGEAFNRWGRHYIPSLAWAHLLQQCNNFKDPGVQKYGGKLFTKIQKDADKTFSDLPPPKPSYPNLNAPPIVSMATYNNQHGGCFDGECYVEMFDGDLKKVKNVKKGDKLKGPQGISSEVVCVVRTSIPESYTQLVEFEGGLKITAWHPVRINEKWQFPGEFNSGKLLQSGEIFTFVLDKGHTVMVNSIECVTLGHNFTDPVVAHPYFGSERVIEDLSKMNGWKDGLVELAESVVLDSTGLIGAFIDLKSNTNNLIMV